MVLAMTIGASSAFLTPIGHKNNRLVTGPGEYQLRDTWRMKLSLELLILLLWLSLTVFMGPSTEQG